MDNKPPLGCCRVTPVSSVSPLARNDLLRNAIAAIRCARRNHVSTRALLALGTLSHITLETRLRLLETPFGPGSHERLRKKSRKAEILCPSSSWRRGF